MRKGFSLLMRITSFTYPVIISVALMALAGYGREIMTKMRISAILVKEEHEAKEVMKSLQSGVDFFELAKRHSVGPHKDKGGDFGYFVPGEMEKELNDVAIKLKVGEYSEPIKVDHGYFILLKTDEKSLPASTTGSLSDLSNELLTVGIFILALIGLLFYFQKKPDYQTANSHKWSQGNKAVASEQKRLGKNLPAAIIAATLAAFVGAGLWASITILTSFQYGVMAIVVGLLVGYAVQFFGKGTDEIFGIVGALFALFGCFLGNMLTVCYSLSIELGVLFLVVVLRPDFDILIEKMTNWFGFVDILFYGIAIYEGYRFSFKKTE